MCSSYLIEYSKKDVAIGSGILFNEIVEKTFILSEPFDMFDCIC